MYQVRKDERVAFSFTMFDEAKTGFISQRCALILYLSIYLSIYLLLCGNLILWNSCLAMCACAGSASSEVEEILRGNHMISIASVQRKAETIMKQVWV